MNFKLIFFISCSLAFAIQSDGQILMRVFVNKKMTVDVKSNEQVLNAEIKLKKYLKIKDLQIEMPGKKVPGPFKYTLQLTDEHDSTLLISAESKSKPGFFIFDLVKLNGLVRKFKDQKLYIIEEPKNSMMRIRSKQNLLINIHID